MLTGRSEGREGTSEGREGGHEAARTCVVSGSGRSRSLGPGSQALDRASLGFRGRALRALDSLRAPLKRGALSGEGGPWWTPRRAMPTLSLPTCNLGFSQANTR
ncbi:hypothetical protein M758_11G164600 [Ceratodon purpureus]|nr:hypothetical protein M758_11G164600 [Ceratodon purpureus]